MGDKKCGGRAVAQGDAVCERMCRRKAGTQTSRTGARTGPRRRGSRERGRHEAMEGRERAGVPKGRTAGGRKLKAQGQRRCGGRRRATGAVPRSNLRAASIEGVEEGRTGRTGRLRRRAMASGRRGRRPRAALAAEVEFQTSTTKNLNEKTGAHSCRPPSPASRSPSRATAAAPSVPFVPPSPFRRSPRRF